MNIKLPNIKDHDSSKIKVDFTNNSFDLKVLDFEKKNWRLTIPKLHASIKADQSNIKVKQNYIFINLAKEGMGSWTDLTLKKKFDPLKGVDKKEDPQQGMMNMMKRMYEDGDDNMKKTITEAWTKARETPPGKKDI